MNAWPIMEQAAARFADRLRAVPDAVAQHVPVHSPTNGNLVWTNVLLTSARFRHGHVETFIVPDRISVLHVCLFPHVHDPRPIYGFDMIAGSARVTGIFLDLSPTTQEPPIPSLREICDGTGTGAFANKRALPDWGHIFSKDVLAIRPSDLEEVDRAIHLAEAALDAFLSAPAVLSPEYASDIIAGQARYIAAQRQNEHTFKMLAGFIGAENARNFVDEVLFPTVSDLND